MNKLHTSSGGCQQKVVQNFIGIHLPKHIVGALQTTPVELTPDEIGQLTEHPAHALYTVPGEVLPASLVDSISQNGLMQPIVMIGTLILDGVKRLAACREVGLPPKFVVLPADAEPFAQHIIISLNFTRRHLEGGQRAMIGAQLCKSLEADALKRSLAALQGEKVNAEGKSAGIAAHVFNVSTGTIKAAKRLLHTKHAAKVWAGEWTVNRAMRELRTDESRARAIANAAASPADLEDIVVQHGDFRDKLATLAANSVDLILTDPPYHEAHLPLWGALATLASRVLKPGGLLVALSGKQFLPEVYAQISDNSLKWVWQFDVIFNGPRNSHPARGFNSRSRPLLIYVKPNPQTKQHRFVGSGGEDVIMTDGVDHSFHPYGQKAELYETLLTRFTKPGALVVDPFGGGGTVAQACYNIGRKCVTTEIQKKHFTSIQKRLFGRAIPTAP